MAGYEFFSTSVGSVHGVRLEDDRRVVVKALRREIDVAHFGAVHRVKACLADGGFPAPRPILAPTALGHGVAIVETLLDDGEWADAHDPAVRRAVAAALVRLVTQARPLAGLVSWRHAYDRLWRQPHDRRFDFAGTARGAEWIDRLAAEARRRIDADADGHPVVGHGDWRVQHLRFAGGALSAVYDRDSLAVGPEPVLAGAAAHAFTADWSVEGLRCVPTIEESLTFLDDDETARGVPFTEVERHLARGGLVAAMAYAARCQHSDRLTGFSRRSSPPDGCLGILAGDGDRLLDPDFETR